MNLEIMDIKELKCLAYDILINIQTLQNDLSVINSLITEKQRIKTEKMNDIIKDEKK